MRIALLLIALVVAPPALAQFFYGGGTFAEGASAPDDQWTQLALGSLNVDRTRIPRIESIDRPDVSTWQVIDMMSGASTGDTCESATGLNMSDGCELTLDTVAPESEADDDCSKLDAAYNAAVAAGGSIILDYQGAGTGTFWCNSVVAMDAEVGVMIRGDEDGSQTIEWDGFAGRGFRLGKGGSGNPGSTVNWTSGYTGGTKTFGVASTASFAVGNWAHCTGTYAEETDHESNGSEFQGLVGKVESIAAGTSITLDRPLRVDVESTPTPTCAPWDPGRNQWLWGVRIRHQDPTRVTCTGDCTCVAGTTNEGEVCSYHTSNNGLTPNCGTIESWYPNLGVQCSGTDYDDLGTARGHVTMHNVVESGVILSRLEDHSEEIVVVQNAVSNLIESTIIGPLLWDRRPFSLASVGITTGGTFHQDNFYTNNVIDSSVVGFMFQDGATGNYVGWSYMTQVGGTWAVSTQSGRGLFTHGDITMANVFEGNDLDSRYEADDTYDKNGYWNTLYRNRFRKPTGSNAWGISTENLSGTTTAIQNLNVIGNHTPRIVGRGSTAKFDQPGTGDDNNTGFWIERNTTWEAGDSLALEPLTSTSCGFDGDADCEGEANAANDTNCEDGCESAPVGWASDTPPDSLVYSAKPCWWCDEACDWAAETGIGAWGDDYNGGAPSYCKLPAQILAEGGTCTSSC